MGGSWAGRGAGSSTVSRQQISRTGLARRPVPTRSRAHTGTARSRLRAPLPVLYSALGVPRTTAVAIIRVRNTSSSAEISCDTLVLHSTDH